MVERFPTLIVCGFVMLIAILLFMIGIILTTLRVKDRHDFEYRLQQIHTLKNIYAGSWEHGTHPLDS